MTSKWIKVSNASTDPTAGMHNSKYGKSKWCPTFVKRIGSGSVSLVDILSFMLLQVVLQSRSRRKEQKRSSFLKFEPRKTQYHVFYVSQRFQTSLLPGLGEDHIVDLLFILGQFEPMHLAFPVRQTHLKQSTFTSDFILQKPGITLKIDGVRWREITDHPPSTPHLCLYPIGFLTADYLTRGFPAASVSSLVRLSRRLLVRMLSLSLPLLEPSSTWAFHSLNSSKGEQCRNLMNTVRNLYWTDINSDFQPVIHPGHSCSSRSRRVKRTAEGTWNNK